MMSSPHEAARCRIGRLHFSFSGGGPLLRHARGELGILPSVRDAPDALRFRFTDSLPELHGHVVVPPYQIAPDAYHVAAGSVEYHVFRSGEVVDASVRYVRPPKKSLPVPGWARRARHWNFLTHEENAAKTFAYNVFDYLAQTAQVALGQSFIHASSLSRDGLGIALLAAGGVGKTSAMLKLVLERNWQFLSDDLGVVDEDGVLWRSPKHLQVYAYNIEAQPVLRSALLGDRSPLDRASWCWHAWRRGPRGVRRRVSAETLLGPRRVTGSAQLGAAFFLERVDVPEFVSVPIGVEELSTRAALILMEELSPFPSLASAMDAVGLRPVLPSRSGLFSSTRRVLARAFAGVERRLVRVPLDAGPDAVSDFLLGEMPVPSRPSCA